MLSSLGGQAAQLLAGRAPQDTLEQNVHIDANFPNVHDAREIEEAILSLPDQISQIAFRNI